jgi:REP element-mobilizing transposase RayT
LHFPTHDAVEPTLDFPVKGHTYTTIRLHVFFSTSGRRPLIAQDVQNRLLDYIGGLGKNHIVPIHEVGGIENHAHILFSLPPTTTVSKIIQTLKAYSSKWMNEGVMKGGRFAWQEGYAAFSVSQSNVEKVADYIRSQVDHHKKHAFEDELKSLLIRNGVRFDERYVLG